MHRKHAHIGILQTDDRYNFSVSDGEEFPLGIVGGALAAVTVVVVAVVVVVIVIKRRQRKRSTDACKGENADEKEGKAFKVSIVVFACLSVCLPVRPSLR